MENDVVSLSIPARPRFGQLLRVSAANLGVRLGWSIIDIDQLRVAIDESTTTLIGPVPQKGKLDATFRIVGDSLAVELVLADDNETIPAERVAHFTEVVEPIVTSAEVDPAGGRVTFTKDRSG